MADALHLQLPHTLTATHLDGLGDRTQGKVRDVYAQKDRLVLIATDCISAFDRVLSTIPFKGEVLNRMAQFWFDRTKHLVRNHVLYLPDPNVTVARRCLPFAIEVVVRGHLTGSLWRDYQQGTHTAYGLSLPAGLKKDERFSTPLITPSTKAEKGEHDAPISEQALLDRGLATPREWQWMVKAALTLFAEGQKWSASRGLIMVDTKYEFGKQGDQLYVIDEIHTPDCSRFWMADEYQARFETGQDQQMLDKENIRQWLLRERGFSGHGEAPAIPDEIRVDLAQKYLAAYQQLTGTPLPLDVGDVGIRIEKNLKAHGLL